MLMSIEAFALIELENPESKGLLPKSYQKEGFAFRL